MLEMLITIGLALSLTIGISDTIALAGLAKGLIRRIGEKDAFKILKKALDKTIEEVNGAEAQNILKRLKDNDKLLHELHRRLDVSEETRKSLVSDYFEGRDDVLGDLAKNYWELFCKVAIKNDGVFKEFVVTELVNSAKHGIATNKTVESVAIYLEEITEEIEKKKEAESRPFLITSHLREVERAILGGKSEIEYVEREEINKAMDVLKTTNKLIVVGKPGIGKTRFMMRVIEDLDYNTFVVIKSFFGACEISKLDAALQEFDSFVLVWDDIHQAKNKPVESTVKWIEQLAREKGNKFLFIGTSRETDEYYGVKFGDEKIFLGDFRNVKLVDRCSDNFGISVDSGVKEEILGIGDGTPFYVISLFASLKERGKKELTLEELKIVPKKSFDIWCEHLKFLQGTTKLSPSEKYVLRSIALAMHAGKGISFKALEDIYVNVFQGIPYFADNLDEVVKKFFIGRENGFYFIHSIQVDAIESIYPLENIHFERLEKFLSSLKRNDALPLLWRFAFWLHKSEKDSAYLAEALKFWDAIIEKEQDLANLTMAHHNRGTTYAEMNQYNKALDDFKEAIELGLEYDGVYSNRGNTYVKMNQHNKALDDFKKAIELNQEDAQHHNNLGATYAELEQHEKAIEEYKIAIKLDPRLSEAHYNLGATYTRLEQHEKAIEEYNKAIELGLENGKIYDNRGIAYLRLQKYKNAIEDYSKAIKSDPEYARAYDHRGTAYLKLGAYQKAIEDYSKLIELIPNRVEAYNNRGIAYGKLDQHEKTIEDYSEAIKLDPGYAESYCNRGIEYLVVGKYGKSVRDLKEGGILFLNSKRYKDAERSFSLCFNMRDKFKNDDIFYCGLALFLLTIDADVIIEIRKMQVKEEALKEILNLTLRKLNGKDVLEEIKEMDGRYGRDEIKTLLTCLSCI